MSRGPIIGVAVAGGIALLAVGLAWFLLPGGPRPVADAPDGGTLAQRPEPTPRPEPNDFGDDLPDPELERLRRISGAVGGVDGTADGPLAVPPGDAAPEEPADEEPPEEPPRVYGMDEDSLRDAMDAVRDDVGDCYRQALAKAPGTAGRMVVTLKIDHDAGAAISDVDEVSIDGVQAPGLDECVADALSDLMFEPDAVGTVSWPFVFSPR